MGYCYDSLESGRRVLLIAGEWQQDTARSAEQAAGSWQWDAVLALQPLGAPSIGPQVTRLSDAISPEEHLLQHRHVTDVLYLAAQHAGSKQLSSSLDDFQRVVVAAQAAGCRLSSMQFVTGSEHTDLGHLRTGEQIKALHNGHKGQNGDAFRLVPDSSQPPSASKTLNSKTHTPRPPPDFRLAAALAEAWTRGRWLLGLLVLQSASSAVLDAYQGLLKSHMVVTFFLTMLVGAGGNAGNQSAIKVIRSLATGKYRAEGRSLRRALLNQALVALLLGGVLSAGGLVRVYVTHASLRDAAAIAASLFLIVMASVLLGTLLPFCLARCGHDPAHAGSSIQVLMDVLALLPFCLARCGHSFHAHAGPTIQVLMDGLACCWALVRSQLCILLPTRRSKLLGSF